MEPEISSGKEELKLNISAPILNIKLFQQQSMMAVFDARGEIHIYSRIKQRWAHITTNKLFQCPIVANDIICHLGKLEFVVVGYDGSIKVCTLTNRNELIITLEFDFKLDSPIVSCLWGFRPNELVMATESQQLILANTALNLSKAFNLPQTSGSLAKVRKGFDSLYLSQGLQISEVTYTINYKDQSFTLDHILIADSPIVDFLVSQDQIYRSLVVLTKEHLLFYIIDEPEVILVSQIKIVQRPICSKLEWGKNTSEVGLYQCINGAIQSHRFLKSITGSWAQSNQQVVQKGSY